MDAIDNLFARYPMLSPCENDILIMSGMLASCFQAGSRLYICGNGGSAADALHITGELVKSFTCKRKLDEAFTRRVLSPDMVVSGKIKTGLLNNLQGAYPVFPLVENISLSTAFANDCSAEYTFAQQVYAYAREGDCVLCISTSGNSENIINALITAKGRCAKTLGLTGKDGGMMKQYCDACICVPEVECYKVQELHMPVYHAICMILEEQYGNI